MFRIGVDVGGTNTDSVVMQGDKILSGVKSPTTEDMMSGVVDAVERAISDAGIEKAGVTAVMIGTTHFTNAVAERRHIARTAAVRLCLPAAQCLPPMVDWPDDMREAVGNHYWMAKGGNEFDGRAISELDMAELDDIAAALGAASIDTVAITSVFSPVSDAMERAAMARLAERLPDVDFTLSSEIGRLGILERENAAIMNASLRALSERTVAAFGRALEKVGVTCPYYITQNDGTLMSREFVQSYPVLTFASGPTNSMRGAAFLSGKSDAIVVDVGGTTTDVGALVKGFPRPASTTVDVGGVRTNFRMPDVFAIGLGGGTIISGSGDDLTVGPQSVGYKLTEAALIFGGTTLTTSDVAVGLGLNNRAPTDDINIRKAIAYATDYETIREFILPGEPLSGPMAPIFADSFADDIPMPVFDLEKAREYVEASRYAGQGPIDIEMMYVAGLAFEEEIGLLMKSIMDTIGFNLILKPEPWNRMTELAVDVDVDTTPAINQVFYGATYPSPDTFFFPAVP